MALKPNEQFLEAASRSQRVLLALPHAAGVDETAAAVALSRALQTQGKAVELVGADFALRPEHALIPGAEKIKSGLPALQRFLITLPLTRAKLSDLSYLVRDGQLQITLAAEGSAWQPTDVRAQAGGWRYDLIITVGAPDLESLGALYRDSPNFWRSVPIINLDHSPANEHFGAINLVDLTAASVSEIVYRLLSTVKEINFDRELATTLLAGIIAKTRSFKTENVSPRTLEAASELMARGAERERIVVELYRTRTVTALRLWGRALARLRHDSERKIVWALLTRQDFVTAGAKEEELIGVLEELIASSPEVAVSFVLYETERRGIAGLVHTNRALDSIGLCRGWSPVGSPRQAACSLGGVSLLDAEKMMLERIRNQA